MHTVGDSTDGHGRAALAVFSGLDVRARVERACPGVRPARVIARDESSDSALPGELPRGAYLPGTVAPPQQTAEKQRFTAQPGPWADDGIRRMADVSCCPGAAQ